jgi:LCP family protein required for cell wall assembly
VGRNPNPLLAAVLSGLVPGTGHLYAGSRPRAWWFLAATGLFVAPATVISLAVLFDIGPSALDLARPFFEVPELLLLLVAANVLIALLRIGAAIDAYSTTEGTRTGRLAAILVGVTTAAAILWPQVYVADRTLALHDLLTYDFSVDPGQATATAVTTPPTATTSTILTTTSAIATTTQPPTSTTTTATTVPPLIDRRINVLLLGGDAGPDRTGIRTDTIILTSIDPISGDTAMFGIPRNLKQMPIPEGHPAYDQWDCHCWPDLVNALYQYGLAHPDLFPGGSNSGATAVTDVLEYVLGIEIHHYVLVDLLGFVEIIDVLGGLTITVTAPVYDNLYTRPGGEVVPVAWDRGTYEMDGEEALSYARVRRDSNDYYRMGRQRCVLEAISAKASPMTLLRALPWLVPAVQGAVVTDIPVADWPDFIELAAVIDTETIVSVRFMPRAPELNGTGTSYIAGYTTTGYPLPNVDLIRETVLTMMTTPADAAAATIGVDPLGEVCH